MGKPKPMSAKQIAALDHDKDGKAGGSLPAAQPTQPPAPEENPVDAAAAEQPDPSSPAADSEAQGDQGGDPGQADGSADDPSPADAVGAGSLGTAAGAPGVGEPEPDAPEQPGPAEPTATEVVTEAAAPAEGDVLEDNTSTADHAADALAHGVALTAEGLEALKAMGASRYGLYRRRAGGFSSDPAGGGRVFADGLVDRLLHMGLCRLEESGGAIGSVKLTDQGLTAVRLAG